MSKRIEIRLLGDEYWWGGLARHGDLMPFHAHSSYQQSLHQTTLGNQAVPLLVSSKGRYVWGEEPFSFRFANGCLYIEDCGDLVTVDYTAGNLREAYLTASQRFFPPAKRIPHELSFTAPLYNTWIDMGKTPTQAKVLQYAREILDAGMPPGILIIDDFWYKNNGVWDWDPEAFPEPKQMIEQLHQWKFLVVLWVSPWVTADTRRYQELVDSRYLILTKERPTGNEAKPATETLEEVPAIQRWWNGASAVLDLSNPDAFAWFQRQLDRLTTEFGIDGFKFDGADASRYQSTDLSHQMRNANEHCEDFGRVGLKYAISEYRACWKHGNQPLLQRVRDKAHSWGVDGLADTLPTSLAHGLMGYAYTCPDMVGGGELGAIPDQLDQELYVRWAQSAALFPLVQYSMLPHRVLDEHHLAICMDMVKIRKEMGQEILRLAMHSGQTGEPILRHMAYEFPHANLERVNDQFMLGDKYLVAPVLNKGQRRRLIRFPEGRWHGDDGSIIEGPCDIEIDVPLTRLPRYRLQG